jgi:hypothetical protein
MMVALTRLAPGRANRELVVSPSALATHRPHTFTAGRAHTLLYARTGRRPASLPTSLPVV